MVDPWEPETVARIELARQRVCTLRELLPLPRRVQSTGEHGDWPISGWAMLSRVGGTAGSVVALIPERRATDAAALLRVMFEATVTLAWIVVEPNANARAWLRWDRRQRIKADNDLRDKGADPLLDASTRSDFERIIEDGPSMPDSLAERAQQADAHWISRSTIFATEPHSPRSLRGMYRYIYRRDSQHTHAAVASIEPLIVGSPPGPFDVAAFESDPGPFNAYTMTPVVLALALVAGGTELGMTGIEPAVDAVFAKYA